MKHIPAALVALSLLAGPAAAFGPTVDMPTLSFPGENGTLSSQGCVTTDKQPKPCE